ncbi:MAG: hypothetical protein JWP11_1764 [Frankiales bacterium]|nr:hypothetical protein [Frankiales bacterium]
MDYSDVPDVEPDATVDPHWAELRQAGWGLPEAYMPPAMGGSHAGWVRLPSWLLIAIFVTATAAGICLTYGPGA